MPFNLGPTELIIILVIVIILFGVGRISRIGADFGRAVSEFRKAVNDNNKDSSSTSTKEQKS